LCIRIIRLAALSLPQLRGAPALLHVGRFDATTPLTLTGLSLPAWPAARAAQAQSLGSHRGSPAVPSWGRGLTVRVRGGSRASRGAGGAGGARR
jgi:hypothetical protein